MCSNLGLLCLFPIVSGTSTQVNALPQQCPWIWSSGSSIQDGVRGPWRVPCPLKSPSRFEDQNKVVAAKNKVEQYPRQRGGHWFALQTNQWFLKKKRNWVSSQTWYALFILASRRFHSPNSYANTKFHAGMTYILMQFHIQTRNPFLLLMAFWWVLFQISNHENIPLVMHLGLKKVIFLNMMALMRWKFAIQLMWNEHNV